MYINVGHTYAMIMMVMKKHKEKESESSPVHKGTAL